MFFSENDFNNFYFFSLLGCKDSLLSKEILWETIHDVNQYEFENKKEKEILIYKKISDSYHDIKSYSIDLKSSATKINFSNIKNKLISSKDLKKIILNNTGLENQVLFLLLNTNLSIQNISKILNISPSKTLSIAQKIEENFPLRITGGIKASRAIKKIIKEESNFSQKYHFLGVLNKNEILTIFLYDKSIRNSFLFLFCLILFCVFLYSNPR